MGQKWTKWVKIDRDRFFSVSGPRICQYLKKKNIKTIKLTMADITLPIASPTWPYPNLKAKSQFNPTFKNKDNRATYIGVLGSCLAKNPTFKILIVMKATNPKQKAFKL